MACRGTNRGARHWDRETLVARLERDAKRAALLGSPLFDAMRPAELDEILKFASERRFRRGQTIFQRGDNGSALMAVLRGRVRISSISGDGKEVTLNVISPGEIFGEIALLDGEPRSADASAIEETTLLVVERRHFLPFLRQNEDLFLRLLAVLCSRLRRTSTALEEIALFDLPIRLARVLLKLGEDYGRAGPGGTRIDLKLSQRDLSNLVAASRESVNKQLRAWREHNVVDLEGGFIVLRRPAELHRLTDVR
jgi:CRP/FNR family cyclic AMP-dependent transcriptional regulator